jgi:hypothetical protein
MRSANAALFDPVGALMMATAVEKAAPAKPEMRLSRAIAAFEASLPHERRTLLHATKYQLQSSPPTHRDVRRLVSEMEKTTGKRCIGHYFVSFLETVRRCVVVREGAAGDDQNIVARGVWAIVRQTMLVSIVFMSG